MNKASLRIEQLLESFPREREEILVYVNRTKKYANECGCSLGATFLATATGVVIVYAFYFNRFGVSGIGRIILWGIPFVLAASIVGKLIGIGVARIRLVLLYRHVIAKYHLEGG
jgi:FtsH-binding integral membrane protein